MKNNYTVILKRYPNEPAQHLVSREVDAKTEKGAIKKVEKWRSDDNRFDIMHIVQNKPGEPLYNISHYLADHNLNKDGTPIASEEEEEEEDPIKWDRPELEM